MKKHIVLAFLVTFVFLLTSCASDGEVSGETSVNSTPISSENKADIPTDITVSAPTSQTLSNYTDSDFHGSETAHTELLSEEDKQALLDNRNELADFIFSLNVSDISEIQLYAYRPNYSQGQDKGTTEEYATTDRSIITKFLNVLKKMDLQARRQTFAVGGSTCDIVFKIGSEERALGGFDGFFIYSREIFVEGEGAWIQIENYLEIKEELDSVYKEMGFDVDK